MQSRIRQLISDTSGSIALIFGLVAPVLAGVAGVAVDYARYTNTVSNLQGLADGAAVAAVRSMAVANMNATIARSSVDSYVKQKAEEIAWQGSNTVIDVQTEISGTGDAVEVQLSQEWSPMLAHVLFGDVKTPAVVTSTARMISSGRVCVLSLNETEDATIDMDDSSRLAGVGCGIFANSTASSALMVQAGAGIDASLICSSGGSRIANVSNVRPGVSHDCPAMPDPLADLAAPSVGPCDYTDYTLSNLVILNARPRPGVYCGGMKLDSNAILNMRPGTYIIKDGPLIITDQAILRGIGVSFYLVGEDARFEFGPATTLVLEAPETGEMAGLLVYEDRGNDPTTHIIKSENARTLLGTIYTPRSTVEVSSDADVAGDSAYTALVVDKLKVKERPNIVLNSNYEATNVPVPPGLIGGKVLLTN
ncbi:MAG: TadE/TadG family type IV pilus assembly protein [Anderseniella sp.]|jgi:Flp pilus assembly protein TadG|nr:TadE/TadG family type IV pilus assembly protein [Anderseniella sp.]